VVILNPRREPARIDLSLAVKTQLLNSGVSINPTSISAEGFSYAIVEID
jgi:hypothetical protein